MNAEFEMFLKGVPSSFEIDHRSQFLGEDLESLRVSMPISVNQLGELVSRHGFVLSPMNEGVYEVVWVGGVSNEDVRALLPRPYRSDRRNLSVRDLGDGRVETCLPDAATFRTALIGDPAVSIDDIAHLYEEALDTPYPFVALANRVTFGDFIEVYPHVKREFADVDEEWEFGEEKKSVILRPDFYGDLQHYLVRKGLSLVTMALDPVAFYHEGTGYLEVFRLDDIGGFRFKFGGHLQRNPGILQLFERKAQKTDLQTLLDRNADVEGIM